MFLYKLAALETRCPRRTVEFVFLRDLCFFLGKGLSTLFGVTVQGPEDMTGGRVRRQQSLLCVTG